MEVVRLLRQIRMVLGILLVGMAVVISLLVKIHYKSEMEDVKEMYYQMYKFNDRMIEIEEQVHDRRNTDKQESSSRGEERSTPSKDGT